MSEQEICDDMVSKLAEEDIRVIRGESDLVSPVIRIRFDASIERYIRNAYRLWDKQNPLTNRWHNSPAKRDIREGIDYSLDHPDAVSARVYRLIQEKLQYMEKGLP